MKIGMNLLLWTNHVTEKDLPLIKSLKEIGFDGVEIPLGDGNVKHYSELGRQISDLGLEKTTVTSLLEDTNIASPNPSVRQAGLDRLKWAIDNAQALGAELICGPIHSAFAYFTYAPPTVDEIKWSIEMLTKAGDYAKEANVFLTPEALNRFECYLCNTMAQMKEILDGVGHPFVGAIFDTHHANIEEKSQKTAIETIQSHLRHVHITENDRGTPGKGQINWSEVFTTLKAVGYNHWLTIEAFSTTIPEFANSINVWRNFSPSEEIAREGYQFIKDSWLAH